MADYEVTQQVFENWSRKKRSIPSSSPIARKNWCRWRSQNAEDDSLVDVYELIINGQEISPGYSELNDPIIQRRRLIEQPVKKRRTSTRNFCSRLSTACRPAGGFGLGIDRLAMLLTGAESIRDVILFPLLRPKRD